MTYKSFKNGIAMWNDVLLLPMKKLSKEGKKRFFKKTIELEDATSYWYYEEPSLYYVKAEPYNKRLVRTNMWDWSPDRIIACIKGKEITASEARAVEEHKSRCIETRQMITNNWSVEWDGKPALLLVAEKPKMSYKEILQVIQNEGGYVDSNGIIRKGTAENKVYTLD